MAQVHHSNEQHPESSFYETTATYAGEWILLKIEHQDDAGFPCGYVHAHSPDDSVIWTQFKDLVIDNPENATKYQVVYGGEYVREGPAMEAAIRKLEEEYHRAMKSRRGAR